ncbi:hypothetical protein FQZ97_678570 [compost metagenome]
MHGNYLRQSIVNAGLDPDNLPVSEPSKMNFGSGDNTRAKAWRDIWGAGQGIGAIKRVVPAAELIARLDEEYNAARHRLGLPPWTTTAKDKTAADQCSDVSFRDRLPRRDPYRERAECRACSRGGNAISWVAPPPGMPSKLRVPRGASRSGPVRPRAAVGVLLRSALARCHDPPLALLP